MKKGFKQEGLIKEETGGTQEEPGGSSRSETIFVKEDWHAVQKDSIKNIEDIPQELALTELEKARLKEVVRLYHMKVPRYYFSLIQDLGDPSDPIRRQCVPSSDELCGEGLETIDPLCEEKTSPTPCMVHRYPDRVLLLVTGRCFMYCRHCTRKRLWHSKLAEPTLKDIELALSYVKANKQIREVVVSGGDPLTLNTERLDYIISSIAKIETVEAIRIGTRAPVVMPQRIDDSLCASLEKYQNLWINVQFNHPREVTPQAAEACRKLQMRGIPISNQAVLLKGVNDDPAVMMELCHKLQAIRIRPYYLYQCDPVVGTAHFRTSIWKGVEIIEKMRGHTSGMCIPTYVIDGIDAKGKIPLGPNYLVSMSPNGVTLRNYKNETFFYHDPAAGR